MALGSLVGGTTVALAGMALGAAALVLDLSNRLFGSYHRTARGFAWRLALVVGSVALLAAPFCVLAVQPASSTWRALSIAAGIAGAAAFVHFLFPYRWGIRRVRGSAVSETSSPLTEGVLCRHVVVRIPSLPVRLDGLKLLAVSDVHCNTQERLRLIRECCTALGRKRPDLVLLLGDFGEQREMLPETIGLLAGIPARFGTFCVLGNHDREGGREALVRELLARHSVRTLSNDTAQLPELGLTLVGIEPPERGPALPPPKSGCFTLGLTHTPDNIRALERLNVDLAVAGHTHGGGTRLPLVGPLLVPSLHGRFLDRGLFQRGSTLLYVTAGLGYFSPSRSHRGEVVRLVLTQPEVPPG